ncbi:hypothetical protein GE061_010681 [Apolygus lucorum]|uniref:DUF4371 domain-containing protein n=1 Tax=Apolygus lucorum TaxID=248454 RepID=A0A8S9XXG9_APOLU|nr:hypothetical protein GE061_010681 [Apolygus lucorum]
MSGRCVVEDLMINSFLSNHWTHSQRVQMLKTGGPSPVFYTNCSSREHEIMTHNGNWLVSVRYREEAVCWPCLLFGRPWFVVSSDNFLTDRINSHRETPNHKVNCKIYRIWVDKNIETEIERKLVLSHELLQCMIDTVCFMLMRTAGIKTEDFLEVLELVTAQETSLRRELNKMIQNKKEIVCSELSMMDNNQVVSHYIEAITKSVFKRMHSRIIRELKDTDHVSLILSQSKDKPWVSVVLRYVSPAGDVVERFASNVRMEFHTPISGISLVCVVLKLLRKFKCEKKLIAYALNGSVLKPQELSKFVSKMSVNLPRARQFLYRVDDLRTSLLEELSDQTYLKVFCHQVYELMRFIVHNEMILQSLKRIIDAESYYRLVTSNLPSEVILIINSHYSAFVQILDEIVSNPDNSAIEVVERASKFLNFLQNFPFRFFIVTLSKIFFSIECLSQALNEGFNVVRLTTKSSDTITSLVEAMKDYPAVFEYTMNNLVPNNVQLELKEVDYEHYEYTYQQILVGTITYINSKTAVVKEWLNSECHLYYELQSSRVKERNLDCSFLETTLKLLKTYDINLNSERLFEQLKVILRLNFFEPLNNDPVEIMKSLKTLDLQETLSEYCKFLELILTVPMVTTATTSRTRVVDKVAACVAGKDIFTTHGWIWINEDLLTTMKLEEDFYMNIKVFGWM